MNLFVVSFCRYEAKFVLVPYRNTQWTNTGILAQGFYFLGILVDYYNILLTIELYQNLFWDNVLLEIHLFIKLWFNFFEPNTFKLSSGMWLQVSANKASKSVAKLPKMLNWLKRWGEQRNWRERQWKFKYVFFTG